MATEARAVMLVSEHKSVRDEYVLERPRPTKIDDSMT